MPTLASKTSLELMLSVQTPEAHGAGHVSVDVVGKPTGCSASGPELTNRRQPCVAPSRQKHTTLRSSPPGDVLATLADSATPLPLLAQECPAIAACRGRELPARPSPPHLTADQTHARNNLAAYSSVRCPGSGRPACLRHAGTTAIQVSCGPCGEGGMQGKRCWAPMSCIPSGCTPCSSRSNPNTASFPLHYHTAGEDVTNVKEI